MRSAEMAPARRERAVFENSDIDGRWADERPAARTGHAGGWRNPPYGVRVVLVSVVWSVPGTLAGLMASLLLAGTADPQTLAVAAGVLFGTAGACREAFG